MEHKFNDLITRVTEYASQEKEGGMWKDILIDLTEGDGRIAVGLFDIMHKRNETKARLGGEDIEVYQGFAGFYQAAAQTVREKFGIPPGESKVWLPSIGRERK